MTEEGRAFNIGGTNVKGTVEEGRTYNSNRNDLEGTAEAGRVCDIIGASQERSRKGELVI